MIKPIKEVLDVSVQTTDGTLYNGVPEVSVVLIMNHTKKIYRIEHAHAEVDTESAYLLDLARAIEEAYYIAQEKLYNKQRPEHEQGEANMQKMYGKSDEDKVDDFINKTPVQNEILDAEIARFPFSRKQVIKFVYDAKRLPSAFNAGDIVELRNDGYIYHNNEGDKITDKGIQLVERMLELERRDEVKLGETETALLQRIKDQHGGLGKISMTQNEQIALDNLKKLEFVRYWRSRNTYKLTNKGYEYLHSPEHVDITSVEEDDKPNAPRLIADQGSLEINLLSHEISLLGRLNNGGQPKSSLSRKDLEALNVLRTYGLVRYSVSKHLWVSTDKGRTYMEQLEEHNTPKLPKLPKLTANQGIQLLNVYVFGEERAHPNAKTDVHKLKSLQYIMDCNGGGMCCTLKGQDRVENMLSL